MGRCGNTRLGKTTAPVPFLGIPMLARQGGPGAITHRHRALCPRAAFGPDNRGSPPAGCPNERGFLLAVRTRWFWGLLLACGV